MSKRINVNPDHYKVSGRERPGKDIVPKAERRVFEQGLRAARPSPHIPNQERSQRRSSSRTLPRRKPETA